MLINTWKSCKEWLLKNSTVASQNGVNVAHTSKTLLSHSNISDSSQLQEYHVASFLPEREDYEAGDDENCSKHGEDEVAGFPPTCVVEHFGWLEWKTGVIRVKPLRVLSSRGHTVTPCEVCRALAWTSSPSSEMRNVKRTGGTPFNALMVYAAVWL